MQKENPKILDVGCGTGVLGHRLNDSGYTCVIDGIDIDNDALILAREAGYRKTLLLDINLVDNMELEIDKDYDVIVLGDVIEHTMDPQKILNIFTTLVDKSGIIVLSIPNVAFLYYRFTHLFGFWEYKETGVMDATHLRFFTRKSSRKLIDSCGLEIIEETPYIGLANWHVFVRITMRYLAKILPTLFAMQHAFLTKLKNV